MQYLDALPDFFLLKEENFLARVWYICYNIANKRRGKKDSLEYREQSCDPAAKVDILVNCQHPKA